MNYYTDNKKVLRHYLSHPLMKRIVAMQERDYTQAAQYNYAPVDFDEAMRRQRMYVSEEKDANEHHKCRIGRGK